MGDQNTLHVKNMVCPRCIDTVKEIFEDLRIKTSSVKLGEVSVLTALSNDKHTQLSEALVKRGFELLEDSKSKYITQIKAILINQIHHKNEALKVNFSDLLSDKLNHDYSYLSRLFSTVEGITIERYILMQKIERVKELIFYNEFTLSEIAYQMNYSSTAHLSTQFKKETGMTPTQFKNQRTILRKSIDAI